MLFGGLEGSSLELRADQTSRRVISGRFPYNKWAVLRQAHHHPLQVNPKTGGFKRGADGQLTAISAIRDDASMVDVD